MADNVVTNAGVGGETFATDEIGGVHYPRSKVGFGADGSYSDVSAAAPLPVAADSLPLPTGAATDATLAALQTLLTTIAGTIQNHNAPFADGTAGQVILGKRRDSDSTLVADGDLNTFNMDEEGRLKVSSKPASYPDITGDITAVQATIGTPVAGGTVSGDVSRASNVMAFCTGTFSTVNVTFEGSLEATGDTNWFGIQAVRSNANTIETATGNLSAAPAYAWEMSVNALKRVRVRCTARTSGTQSWRIVQGTYATEPIPAAQVSATQPVSGTVTAAGTAAHDAAISGNPVRFAGRALTANYTAVATGDTADLVTTLVGALIQKPYAIPESDWQYAAASGGIINTTDVAVKAAAAAGIRNYVTGIQVRNASAVATEFVIKDGASTVIWRAHLPANMADTLPVEFPTPLKGSAATAVNVACITTGAAVFANLQGYIAP